MRFFPQELYIMRLKDEVFNHPRLNWLRTMTKEECAAELKEMSGLDYGQDGAAWEEWWKRERKRCGVDPGF